MSPDPRPPVSDQTPTPEVEPWCRIDGIHGRHTRSERDTFGPACPGRFSIGPPAPPAPTPEPRRATVCKHPEHAPGVGESHCHCWLNLEDPCCWCGSDEDSADPCPNRPTPSPVSPEDGEGVRSQTEQWFVVHHNQIRALRFAQFPIERLARASIAACTCGPHTLRHTVITTYTASDETEFVAARPSGAVS